MMPIQPLHLLLASFCVIADITAAFAPPVRSGSSSARQGKVPFLSFITRRILQVDNEKRYDDYRNGGAGRGSLNVVSIDPKKTSSSKSADYIPPRIIGDAAATMKNVSSDLNTENVVNDSDVGKEIFLSHLQENLAVAKLLSASSADSTSSLNDMVPNPTIVNGGANNDVSEEIASDTGHIADASRAVNEIAKASLPGNVAAAIVTVAKSPAIVEKATRTTKGTPPRATTSTTTTSAPNVAKILKFAIPATGVWLCGPLLSLIDTSTVGILSGTVQQAALNPAVAVTDYAALLIAFLYTGTTNLIASARDSHGSDGDQVKDGQQRMIQRLIGALQLSTFVGAGLGTILFCFAKPLLTTIIGNDGISPAVFDAAMKYVKIRAIGMPAAAVIGSAQAACLGLQDIKSPLYVLAVAAAVNFMGDMLFVGSSHPLIGGAAGAAWATVFSQYAAVGLFIHWLCHKPQNQQVPPKVAYLSKPSKNSTRSTTSKPKEPSFSVRGFLQGRFRARDLLKPPSRQLVQEFSPYVLPVTSTQVGRVSGYVAMAHVVSSSLGTVSMAAQQVIVSLFYCLCPMADALSLTAQSFVPAIYEKPPSKQRTQALRKTIVNFVKAGAIFGSIMVAAVAGIPLMSRFFTTDQVVMSMVNQVVPLLISFFSVHGILCAAEGLLVGQKDLGFLGKMYAGYFFAMPFFMMRVKKAALSGTYSDIGLTSVWRVFVGYQAFRFSAWMIRVGFLQRRNERKTPTTQTVKSVPAVTNGGGLATAASGAM